mmetsp:Transcript_2281/g.7031  ORF Transcript_2281/g.7031 Transcript_2281/m.7031 type:complete len:214 (-) Transcript_2281:635-1276(-)
MLKTLEESLEEDFRLPCRATSSILSLSRARVRSLARSLVGRPPHRGGRQHRQLVHQHPSHRLCDGRQHDLVPPLWRRRDPVAHDRVRQRGHHRQPRARELGDRLGGGGGGGPGDPLPLVVSPLSLSAGLLGIPQTDGRHGLGEQGEVRQPDAAARGKVGGIHRSEGGRGGGGARRHQRRVGREGGAPGGLEGLPVRDGGLRPSPLVLLGVEGL